MASPISPMIRVARGASTVFITNISSVIVGFIYMVLLARFLMPYGMGILTILFMISGFTMTFAGLGLGYAPPKYLPELLSTSRNREAAGFYNATMKLSLASSCSLAAFIFIIAPILSTTLTGTSNNTLLFQILALTIVTGAISSIALTSVQGIQLISSYATIGFTSTTARRFIGLGLLAAGLGLPGLLYGWIIGDLIGIIPALRTVRRHLRGPNENFPLKTLMRFSIPLLGYTTITFISDWVDRILLLHLSTISEVGIYFIAVSAFGVIGTISTSIFVALYPQLSELQAREGLEALGQAFTHITRYFLFIFTPIIFGATLFAYPIIWIFAGENYIEASTPFAILALGGLGYQFAYIFNSLLMASGRTRTVFATTAAASVIFLASGIILTEPLGMVGAAMSKAVSYTALLILTVYALSRLVTLRVDYAALWKPTIASTTATLITFTLINLQIPLPLIARYSILGAFFIAIYLTTLIILKAPRQEDYHLLQNLLPQKLHPLINIIKKRSESK